MNGYPIEQIFLLIIIGIALWVWGIYMVYELMWRAVRRGMREYDKKRKESLAN